LAEPFHPGYRARKPSDGCGRSLYWVEASSRGELGEAAQAFNAMVERLEQSAVENARLYYAVCQRAERTADVIRRPKLSASPSILAQFTRPSPGSRKHFIPYNPMGMVIPEESGKRLRIVRFASDQPDATGVGRVWSDGKGTGIEWVMTHRRPYIEQDLAEAQRCVEEGVL